MRGDEPNLNQTENEANGCSSHAWGLKLQIASVSNTIPGRVPRGRVDWWKWQTHAYYDHLFLTHNPLKSIVSSEKTIFI